MNAGRSRDDAPHRAAKPLRDLTPRLISAIPLAIGALALVYAGGWAFVGLVSISGAVIAWEWGNVVRGESPSVTTAAHALAATLGAVATAYDRVDLALLCVVSGLAIVAVRERHKSTLGWSLVGVAATGLAAVSLTWIRLDPASGAVAILYLFLIVWTTDTAAFAAGRTLQGPKLMPSVSPKKTWWGFAGGLIGPILVGLVFGLAIGLGLLALPLALQSGLLALATQAGDLGESAMKRRFGVKDSSALIPGHGGLLDRIDGLILAASMAALISAIRDADNPASALLYLP